VLWFSYLFYFVCLCNAIIRGERKITKEKEEEEEEEEAAAAAAAAVWDWLFSRKLKIPDITLRIRSTSASWGTKN